MTHHKQMKLFSSGLNIFEISKEDFNEEIKKILEIIVNLKEDQEKEIKFCCQEFSELIKKAISTLSKPYESSIDQIVIIMKKWFNDFSDQFKKFSSYVKDVYVSNEMKVE